MANPAHLEKLCEGPKAWNDWREANPNIVPDLTEIKLTLHQRQLGPSNGGPIDLRLADLEHASLPYATLSGADLEGARLIGADLTHARLDGARLIGADLTDAVLDQADLTGAVLDHSVLFGAQLSNTRNLTAGQLSHTYGDGSTRLPGNILPPESWFPSDEYNSDDEDDYAGWGSAAPYEEEPEQNLYEALGLSQTATQDEIRTSYRSLVKKLHPDLNPNDQEAQDRFKKVTTAYRILNDQAQRQRYDRGEIDGEGRVNPEFEARKRFRRAAFRYYTMAAGSFCIAVGALVAVWYTVLSERLDEKTREVAVVAPQPKRAERLGADRPAPKPIRIIQEPVPEPEPEKTAEAPAPAPEQQPSAETPPAPQMAEAPPAPEAAEPPSAAETTAAPAEGQAVAEATPEPEPEIEQQPGIHLEAGLSMTPPSTAAQGSGAEQPTPANAAPSPDAPSQAAPEQAAGLAMAGAAAPAPASAATRPAEGETAKRPLPFRHRERTGQTATSAPDEWVVGSIRPAGAERKTPLNPDYRSVSLVAEKLPPASQWPVARDSVSQVLRSRAVDQSLGRSRRPLTASDVAPVSGRRTEYTSALPAGAPATAKPRPAPAKRTSAPAGATSASQPRKQQPAQQQTQQQTPRVVNRSQTTASNVSVEFEERQ